MSKKENYGLKIMRAVRDNRHFDKNQRLLLWDLALHRNEDTAVCNPSIERLVETTRLWRNTVFAMLTAFEKDALISRRRSGDGKGGRGHSTQYDLHLEVIKNWQPNSPHSVPVSEARNSLHGVPDSGDKPVRSEDLNRYAMSTGTLKNSSLSSRESAKRTHRRSEKDSKPDPRVSQFVAWWAEEYQRRVGSKYHFDGGKDGRLIKTLLRTFSLEELEDVALRYFEDKWIQDHRGFSIGEFYTRVNNIRSQQGASNNRTTGGFVGQ